MGRKIEVSKQTDHDGFSSFECSLCKEEFKLVPGDVEEEHVLEIFCPSCGIPQSPSEFLTEDILEHAQAALEQEAFNMINEAFKGLEKSFKRSKSIKFKAGKPLKARVPQTLFEQKDYSIIEFTCCSKQAKLSTFSQAGIGPYCPYCGVN